MGFKAIGLNELKGMSINKLEEAQLLSHGPSRVDKWS